MAESLLALQVQVPPTCTRPVQIIDALLKVGNENVPDPPIRKGHKTLRGKKSSSRYVVLIRDEHGPSGAGSWKGQLLPPVRVPGPVARGRGHPVPAGPADLRQDGPRVARRGQADGLPPGLAQAPAAGGGPARRLRPAPAGGQDRQGGAEADRGEPAG